MGPRGLRGLLCSGSKQTFCLCIWRLKTWWPEHFNQFCISSAIGIQWVVLTCCLQYILRGTMVFDLRMNTADTMLEKDLLGYFICWLKKLPPISPINVAMLSFLSVGETRCVHKEQIGAKGRLGYFPGIAEGAHLSYRIFFGVIIWSQISLLQLGRSWQTSKTETPSICSMKKGCVLSAGGVSEKVVEGNANSTPSHSLSGSSTASLLSSLFQVSWATVQCISVCCLTNSSCGFQADK